ncbi:MAG: hypothetical protein KGM99_17025 [Burkholderiales bacterium]|nr:hypothetical protein [Burkholderiales bacterium]
MKRFTSMLAYALAGSVVSLLTACGGAAGNGVTGARPTALSGTAATGMAIAGANVSAKCRAGGASTTTNADGGFQVAVANGSLPCLLEVTNPADGNKLHSIAVNSGVVNITPLTEMASARLLHADMTTMFAGFDPNVLEKAVFAAAIKLAQDDVSTVLQGIVDTSKLSDFFSTPMKAATPANRSGGDAQDQLLDQLKLKMSGTQFSNTLLLLQQAAPTGKPVVNSDPGFQPTLDLLPASMMIAIGGKQSFGAAINYPPNVRYLRQPVKWAVEENDGGSISINGEYTAPQTPGVFHVLAQREDFPEVSATATVTVNTAVQPAFTPYLTVRDRTVHLNPGDSYFFSAAINYRTYAKPPQRRYSS